MTEEELKLRIKHVIANMQNLIETPFLSTINLTEHWQLAKINRTSRCTNCSSIMCSGDVVWVRKSRLKNLELELRHNMIPCKNDAEEEIVKMLTNSWSHGSEERSETALAVMRLAGFEGLFSLVNSGE